MASTASPGASDALVSCLPLESRFCVSPSLAMLVCRLANTLVAIERSVTRMLTICLPLHVDQRVEGRVDGAHHLRRRLVRALVLDHVGHLFVEAHARGRLAVRLGVVGDRLLDVG